MQEQALNQMGDGLNINWESLSIEALQKMDTAIIQNLEDRKAIDPDDRALTDLEVKTRDMISFFIEKKENQNEKISLGDIFYSSWGWEQTNIDYFQVVKISPTGKTCQVLHIGSKRVPGSLLSHGMADQVEPDPSTVLNPNPCQVRIQRSTSFNPITQKREEIGPILLRGSVYYCRDSKHLETLFRSKGSHYRSWYG